MKVFWAHVRANAWCLFHFGNCIYVEKDQVFGCVGGNRWVTTRIEAGKGSILNGTWKTSKVFYQREVKS